MISTLIVGKEVAQFDSQITGKLSLDAGTEKAIRMERMQIGVRNEKGDIYRAIGVTGMGDFLDTINHLVDVGLVDELQHVHSARHGYDAIFSIAK